MNLSFVRVLFNLYFVVAGSVAADDVQHADNERPSEPTVIAFGSCAHEGRPQPIWDAVVETKPDLFILAGDNIYGDTNDMDLLNAKYAQRKKENIVGWYQPTKDTSRTLLGEAQWLWLELQLKKEAEVRLIVSSIQVVSWEKGMECWGNLPHERDRLFKLIETTGAEGAVFLSGDVHFTELSRTTEGRYPLYDFTSSGLNQSPGTSWHRAINKYRLPGKVYTKNNFGVVRIDWAGNDTTLTLQARTENGEVAYQEVVLLKQLK